ncbi:tyrosine-type recombinase/integrase [Alteribacter natronophilus]|uniref:tyrosine-type recombinase/integrase n=1 Tax=Alteribacter natronophilus TaxID=2583810 RepID=UPI00110E7FB9|nr:tyrosine-type recombinase/integrase [Alteribacter natronophilus]TMW70379.1 site-specific integrase [Alteribacter natronophilus]
MEYVEPITDVNRIKEVKEILKRHSLRDYALFTMGINTGLRITELLEIKLSDIWDSSGSIAEFYSPWPEESTHFNRFYLNGQTRQALNEYLFSEKLGPDDYLFQSSRGPFPISRQHAYRVIHQAAREAGITSKIGTHTMRKTFGYHAYHRGVAISLIQKIYHHSSRKKTYEYLGIDPGNKNSLKIDVDL